MTRTPTLATKKPTVMSVNLFSSTRSSAPREESSADSNKKSAKRGNGADNFLGALLESQRRKLALETDKSEKKYQLKKRALEVAERDSRVNSYDKAMDELKDMVYDKVITMDVYKTMRLELYRSDFLSK